MKAAQRELSKTKQRLAARERQFQIAVKAMKAVVAFKSAQLSIFSTEVQQIQRLMLRALLEMENVQRKKPLTVPRASRSKAIKEALNAAYGPFLKPVSAGQNDD